MTKKIWIALVDDWELRGNGLGNVRDLQYEPAIKLMNLYDSLGVKNTFNAEVMQQLAFQEYANKYPEIKEQHDLWLDAIKEMISRGHDVQLHIHPQWHNATYDGRYWKLDNRWNIADYKDAEIKKFVKQSIIYLRNLVGENNVRSFRSGAWGIANVPVLMEALENEGIVMDVSIVDGISYAGESITLDYTQLEEPYKAYYPLYADARRIADGPVGVVEVPTQSVRPEDLKASFTKLDKLKFLSERLFNKLIKSRSAPAGSEYLPAHIVTDPFGFKSGNAHESYIIDLSADHDIIVWRKLADIVISRAISWQDNCFLVFENHTKNVRTAKDFKRIEKVIKHIQHKYSSHVEFVTLSQMAAGLERIKPLEARSAA